MIPAKILYTERAMKQTAKEKIISVLSQNWPLSARKIYHLLQRSDAKTNVSYQAVHKILKSMTGEGILEKSGLKL